MNIYLYIFIAIVFMNIGMFVVNIFTGALDIELNSAFYFVEYILKYILIPSIIFSIIISYNNWKKNKQRLYVKEFLIPWLIFGTVLLSAGFWVGFFPFINYFLTTNELVNINGRIIELRKNERNNIFEITILNEKDREIYIKGINRYDFYILKKNDIIGLNMKKGGIGVLYSKKLYINKVEKLYFEKKYEEALSEANRVLKIYEADYYSLYYRIIINIENGNYKQIQKDIDKLKNNYFSKKSKTDIEKLIKDIRNRNNR